MDSNAGRSRLNLYQLQGTRWDWRRRRRQTHDRRRYGTGTAQEMPIGEHVIFDRWATYGAQTQSAVKSAANGCAPVLWEGAENRRPSHRATSWVTSLLGFVDLHSENRYHRQLIMPQHTRDGRRAFSIAGPTGLELVTWRLTNSQIRRVFLTVLNSFLRQFCLVSAMWPAH